jgi:cytochrome c-type biogenesis protein CcsB
MESIFLILATICYALGTVGYLVYLFREQDGVHRTAWTFLLAGAVLHGGAIVLRSVDRGHLAVTGSSEALSFFSWLLVVVYLIIQGRIGLRILGTFVSPLAVVFMLASRILPETILPSNAILRSAWVTIHVISLFSANALFAVAFCTAVMYLLQEREIKQKRFGLFFSRLPSLDRLDRIGRFCLLAGFPLMTAGLVTGFIYANSVWRSPWNWDPKEIFALITWCIYAVLLHERLAVGWRGRKAAWLAIFGFSAVLVTFLGVNLVFKGHHTVFIR